MDGAALSPYPHHLWLGYEFDAPADGTAHCWNLNGHAHALHMVFRGPHGVRWISKGRETPYAVRAGSFHYLPADGDTHTIVARASDPIRSYTVFVPQRHLTDIAIADHMDHRVEFHRLLVHDDPVLQACMRRLAGQAAAGPADGESAKDEAARTLVLRLLELSGAGTPDWRADASTFTNHTMRYLVEYIDAHLRIAPSISDMGVLAGLSPSQFAKKFRRSTGLSLHRFVNRRRLRRSLDLLRHSSESIAGVALQLGFSSQAHFTHLFSDLTCMTPAKFRKQFRRTVG